MLMFLNSICWPSAAKDCPPVPRVRPRHLRLFGGPLPIPQPDTPQFRGSFGGAGAANRPRTSRLIGEKGNAIMNIRSIVDVACVPVAAGAALNAAAIQVQSEL